MKSQTDYLDVVDHVVGEGIRRGALYQLAEDAVADGRTLTLDGRRVVHLGSCSYVGLELDERLKQGAIEATLSHGTQFASSRAFVRAGIYRELETLLDRLFGMPTLTAQTTTLLHVAALPVALAEGDAVILDHQVHQSVVMAVNHARLQGTHVELVRHSRMDLLAERVEALSKKHRHVWYMCDGVYSMLGDFAPMDALRTLLDRYDQFRLYVDDAHGMSWTGLHGRGFALGTEGLHDRMLLATSLCKAFAAGGAVLLVKDPELRRRIGTISPTMIFGGPLQPPLIGAAAASARIHLSDDIVVRQQALLERIRLFNSLMSERGLAPLSMDETPVRCLGLGPPRLAYAVAERLVREGYYANTAVYPAVPRGRAGLRVALTTHLTTEDITGFADALVGVLDEALGAEGLTRDDLHRNHRTGNLWGGAAAGAKELTLEHQRSARSLDATEWDRLLGARGSFTVEGLLSLESIFRDNAAPENNWGFHYYVVRDAAMRPVLATFFTDALWKDDMLASEEVSRKVEAQRVADPYFLTSRGLSMGSLLTEGDHLFLDRDADWRRALTLLFEHVSGVQRQAGAQSLMLRDLPAGDDELATFLHEQGFLRFAMPESHVLPLDFTDEAAWLDALPGRFRGHLRKNVLPFDDHWTAEILGHRGRPPRPGEVEQLYRLYLNTKGHSLAINSFALPEDVFAHLLESPAWEVLTLTLKPEHGGAADGTPSAMAVSLVGPEQYAGMIAGFDYGLLASHGVYRRLMLQVLRRAREVGARRLLLGLGAAQEKRRFGARAEAHDVWVLGHDDFASSILVHMMGEQRQGEA
jgi:7-keto-8-aminopelargonate synthetase-like enzyme